MTFIKIFTIHLQQICNIVLDKHRNIVVNIKYNKNIITSLIKTSS